MTTNGTPRHYSATQVNMYLRCSAQYFFRYIEGLKVPPSIVLTLGRAVDHAVSLNFEQKIKTHADVPSDIVTDAFVTSFDAELGNTVVQPDEEPQDARAQGIGLVQAHHASIAPQVQPKAVQQEAVLEFENVPYRFKAFMDVVTVDACVRDTKTTSKTPPADATGRLQPANPSDALQGDFYRIGYEGLYGQPPASVHLDYLVKNKTPKVATVTLTPAELDVSYALEVLGRVDHAIQSEVFIPNRQSLLCSKRHCGYWKSCVAQFGGSVKD